MYKLVSLFSGGGGLDCGLQAVGFQPRFCTDIDERSCITLRHSRFCSALKGNRHNTAIVQSDINDLDPKEILKRAGLKRGEADLLTGGPPCQSFSVFGQRRGLDDPRGRLVWQYLRILRGIRPRIFLFENVPGLLTIDQGAVFERFLEEVQTRENGCSYKVQKYVLEAARYGVPQFRTRVIVIGVLNGSGLPPAPKFPPIETHAEPSEALRLDRRLIPFNTVAEALHGLAPIGDPNAPRNHIGRVHSDAIIARYRNLAYGERDSVTRINKLHPERPSYTIIVGSDKGGGKGHVHPFEPREVTPRESARIQTFPDWWGFSGTSRHPIRQIGNAVPPVLAASLGTFILEEIFGTVAPSRKTVLQSLGQGHLLEAEEKKVSAQVGSQSFPDSLCNQPELPDSLRPPASTQRSVGL